MNPNLRAFIKKNLAVHIPVLSGLVLPRHRFALDPIELASLVGLIEATKGSGGAVVEIGVEWGHTSVFLLEHLRSTENPAKVVLIDTFDGFTEDSITYEVTHRSKTRSEIDRFKHGSRRILEGRLRRLGYDGFEVLSEDCQQVNWDAIGPIAVALIDVDLYLPTKHTLENIWPYLLPGGGCLVDDCREGVPWDGALQACSEFVEAHKIPILHVGRKGWLLQKAAYGSCGCQEMRSGSEERLT